MPVYSKPMIYYPLTTLMLAGITDILVITAPEDQSSFQKLLQDGSQWGIHLSYAIQPTPAGLGQAFVIGKEFIGGDGCAMVLGDNIFYAHGLSHRLQAAARQTEGATVFAYWVDHPEQYGVVEFDEAGRAVHLQEKPPQPRSHYAVTGLYFYDNQVADIAASLKPSARNEYEITDINQRYLEQGQLRVEKLGRGTAWLDTGTHESLLQAANFVAALEQRQGLMVACPEEIAFRMNLIDREQLLRLAKPLNKNAYGRYLEGLAEGRLG
jgi:glucose-1-phosphate thymidylyltransferase